MAVADIATATERADCHAVIEAWTRAHIEADGVVVAVDRDEQLDRWYLRLRGDEKDFITIWLTIRQRTLHHEAQMMPAPEVNVQETYEYVLRRNAELRQMRFCLGPENALYLVGEIPVNEVTEQELDRIIGSSLSYVDDTFPTAMTIGFAGRYRRRGRAAR